MKPIVSPHRIGAPGLDGQSVRRFSGVFAAAAALALGILAAGCSLTPLAKHTAAFSTAATQVINSSEDAYRAAIDLHDQEQVSAGVLRVEAGKPWNYDELTPLISAEGLKTRVKILDALKTYTQSLSDVTWGLDSPALTAAATSAGSNLKTLGATFASDPEGAKTGISVSAQTANIVSTASLALGEYLVSKKVKSALPAITGQMDPQIEALCKLLTDDIDIIRRQSRKDYEDLSRQEWTFIQVNKEKFTPVELRNEIEKLPTYRMNEQSTEARLAALHAAIGELALTHHALAAAAQGNNPEAFNARIADLEAAGTSLGHYYQSLPSK
jgi:hypothetical protein